MKRQQSRKTNGGFTLVELMIVLIIGGIIIVLAWPKIEEALDGEKVGRTFGHLSSIKAAADERRGTKGQYPNTVSCPQLIASEYLKVITSCTSSNPFNGNYTSAPAANPSQLILTATAVPTGACAKLVDRFTDGGATATCSGTTLTVTI